MTCNAYTYNSWQYLSEMAMFSCFCSRTFLFTDTNVSISCSYRFSLWLGWTSQVGQNIWWGLIPRSDGRLQTPQMVSWKFPLLELRCILDTSLLKVGSKDGYHKGSIINGFQGKKQNECFCLPFSLKNNSLMVQNWICLVSILSVASLKLMLSRRNCNNNFFCSNARTPHPH